MGPVAAVFTVASAVMQYKANKEAQKANEAQQRAARKTAAIQQRVADIKAQRARQNTIRQARIAIASAKASAVNVGGDQGSVLAGYTGGIKTQTAAALGESQMITAASREATGYNIEQSIFAQGATNKAGKYQDLATIFGTGAKAAGQTSFPTGTTFKPYATSGEAAAWEGTS